MHYAYNPNHGQFLLTILLRLSKELYGYIHSGIMENLFKSTKFTGIVLAFFYKLMAE